MTQMDTGYANVNTRSKTKGKMNVYTALMALSTVLLIAAIVVVLMKYNELYGSWNVFEVVEPGAATILSPWLHLLG